jgi:DNA-binding PadR family transcriptional regulator
MFKSKHRTDRSERRHARDGARDAYWHEGGGRGRGHRAGGGGGSHRGGGRRGRVFDQGDLRLIMLELMTEAPRHGYEIIKSIEEKVGGAYSPSPGVVYPTLTLLEEMGFATVASTDGARKLYAITPEGKAHLDTNRATLDAIAQRMKQIGDGRDANAPQIERAVENLRTALRLRLERGLTDGDSQTTVQIIADALDAAAKKIEQS